MTNEQLDQIIEVKRDEFDNMQIVDILRFALLWFARFGHYDKAHLVQKWMREVDPYLNAK